LPGVVFLFLAIGAAASGLMLWVAPDVSLESQLAVFAVFSVASAVALRPTLKHWTSRGGEATLNARGDALVGKVFVLDQPILGGRGRAKLGDSSWIVTGPDMVAGAKVRVAAVNGTELTVEPAP
jgi:inner membrane protein